MHKETLVYLCLYIEEPEDLTLNLPELERALAALYAVEILV